MHFSERGFFQSHAGYDSILILLNTISRGIKIDKHIMNSAYFTMFWAVKKYSLLFHTGQNQPSPPLHRTWPHQMLNSKKLWFMSALPQQLDFSVNYPGGLVSLPVLNKLQITALVLVFLSRVSEADTSPTPSPQIRCSEGPLLHFQYLSPTFALSSGTPCR